MSNNDTEQRLQLLESALYSALASNDVRDAMTVANLMNAWTGVRRELEGVVHADQGGGKRAQRAGRVAT